LIAAVDRVGLDGGNLLTNGRSVSDKPLHGEIKLAGMAGEFYRQRVGQHLAIGLKALEKLKAQEWERLHSRKLRSFAEVAFQ
jgi:AMP nucleosidase